MEVFLATPAYDGKVIPQFEESLKASLRVLRDAGIPAHWECLSGCCYLPIARNKLVKKFLESGMSDLVFVDADIEWEPDDLLRLLSHPVDIVAGPYRHKTWEETYPVWYRTDDEHRPVIGGLSDLVECWTVPTGFMRMTRRVFDLVDRHCGNALDVEEYNSFAQLKDTYRNYFDTGVYAKQWWGEDTAFCRRWTIDMGLPLWVDPHIVLSHWGTAANGAPRAARGSFHEYLSRLPGGANDPGYHDNGIEGYTVVRELQWLNRMAKDMNSIVEVGSYLGRSAHALLSGCPGIVTCVDTWLPLSWEDGDSEWKDEERFKHFLGNTSQFHNRAVLRMSSLRAASMFIDGSVDMVFIDGNHDKQPFLEDLAAWLPKTRKMICGHDYDAVGWPEVKEVVDEKFGDRVQVFGTIWFVEL
jgi:predicted O-methyltransferase YrrM